MRNIATRVSQLTGEGALAVFARAKELEKEGRSVIHLELGEPDFHPASPVVDALRAAAASGRDRYVATRGIPPLRAAIAAYLKRTRGLDAAAEQVLVAPGCKMALSLAMMALIEPGDEVLYPDPSFPIYPSFTRGLGAKPVAYRLREENKFQPDIAEIAAKITPQARMLIFNSPNNPTGTVFSADALKEIAALAQKHDLWILSDEIYARILFQGEYKSIWSLPGLAERTVIIDGFSKSFAMTGWRLGYA
ncbi:MAG TPA: aminotransferase class I/II-fold pyridoxal phosphate-dependent enzyme, partial [Candidatus Acidoferrum sp.]